MNVKVFKNIPLPIWITSAVLAFLIDIKAINRILVYGGYIPLDEGGLMVPLYLFAALLLSVMAFYQNSKGMIGRFNRTGIILALYLSLYYLFTIYFIGEPYTSLPMFALMTVFSFLIPQYLLIDTRIFIKATMFYPLVAIPRLFHIFELDGDALILGISMDVSYGFLPSIIASIVYYFGYLKFEKGKIRFLSYLAILGNSYIFFYILLFGSRAPLLCIVLLFVFFYVCKFADHHVKIVKSHLRKTLLISLVVLVAGIAMVSLLNSIFQEYGLEIIALKKIMRLAEEGDISNGRSNINDLTWSYIFNRPIFGYGFDRYNALTGKLYPHNFLLQLLFDGGIILFVIVILPLWRHFLLFFRNCTREQYYLIIMLFFASVPGALFSQNMWQIVPLWVCFGAIFHCQTTDGNIASKSRICMCPKMKNVLKINKDE